MKNYQALVYIFFIITIESAFSQGTGTITSQTLKADDFLLWPDITGVDPSTVNSNLYDASQNDVLVRSRSDGTVKYRSSSSITPWIVNQAANALICNPELNLSLDFIDVGNGSLKIGESAFIDNDEFPDGSVGDNWIGFNGPNGHINISSASTSLGIKLLSHTSSEDYLNLLQNAGFTYMSNSQAIVGGGANPYYFLRADASQNVEFPGVVKIGDVDNSVAVIPTNYKLAVDGDVIANRVRVDKVSDGWPDYVFEPEYKMASLEELQKFINENGHLPGIPSAEDVESHGIDLGSMEAKLLEKIEELTLHLIHQNERIKSLEAENQSLKKE